MALLRRPRPGIVRTLIGRVIVLSLTLTALFTGIQALVDYHGEVKSIRDHLAELRVTHVPGISEALWSFDRQALATQLNGILSNPYVAYVAVAGKDGVIVERGRPRPEEAIRREYPLTREYNGRTLTIGTLSVQGDASPAIHHILGNVARAFLMELAIVAAVSAFIFLLFNRLVTRHLAQAAVHFQGFDLGSTAPLVLPKERTGDEIDTLVDAFNAMQDKLAKAYRQLREREQELRESEQRLQLATASARLGVWDWDIVRDELTWDDRMFELYGLTRERFPGGVEAWEGAIHPEDRARGVSSLAASLRDERAYDLEFRVVRPDGAVRILRAAGIVLRDESGQPLRMIGLNWDVTEPRRAARALLAAESRYKSLLETVQLAAVMLDGAGNVTFCNDYLLDLTGWRREEVLGRSWFDLFIPEEERDAARSMLAASRTKEGVLHYESTIVTRNNRRRLIAWNNSLVKDEEGNVIGAASIGTDLTDHRKMEEQLRQSTKMDSIGRLAGGIAHDFNNVLSVIMGYAELAMLSLPEGAPLTEHLREIAAAADRSRNITRQLLAFSRKEVISPRPTNLNTVIPEINKSLVRLIGEDICLDFRAADDLWNILVDPAQIDQVLVNLAINARDAMPRGGSLTIETANTSLDELYCREFLEALPGDYVLLTVGDDGVGMSTETREHIFEPFYTTKEVGKGTGLGLATVYGIVTQNGGFVHVYSELGHGTVFRLYFPRVVAAEAPKAPTRPLAATGSGTVLLVEDDPQVRAIAASMLRHLGYTAVEAASPSAALQIASDRREIDLLLTDVVMPDMTGKELYEAIRKTRPQTRVLFMSGYTAEIIAQRGVLEQHVQFLQKPFDVKTLAAKLQETFALAPPVEET